MTEGEPVVVRGVVLPDGEPRDLFVANGRITYEPIASAREVASGWIVPGLVDAHCHIGLGPDGPVDEAEQERQALAERAVGMLLARDAGSAADTRWIDRREDLPKIIRAGRHLARTGRYLRNYGIELEPPALPAAAADQATRGDGWVKIVADWIDRGEGDLTPCWPADALAEAVRSAQAAGARVTVHTFDEQGVADAIAAGVDCVEHGTGLSEQLIDTMAGRGTALVPTLINVANFPVIAERASRFPAYAEHMRRLHATAPARVAMAYEAGVPVFAGTDAGGAVEHGRVAEEVVALHAAGLPAEAALGAASWAARQWLGRPGLGAGDPADLVVYQADPRKDLRVLFGPSRVILRGRIVL